MIEEYMRQAIEIAKKGMGKVSPNPMVGCIVVKNGTVISRGYHEEYGKFHAERNALLACMEDPEGAELYVTLEPCCHYGKTPPCTEIIIEKKIKKVYVGAMDSNPLVAGKGVNILKEHGIEVETGILEKECRQLNEIFFHFIEKKTPFVALKYAMTLDGKIAAQTGDSKWITEKQAREHVHLLRKKYKSILVGIDTVLADNPMLNCRIEKGVDPIRIILDSKLRIPLESQICKTAKEIPTIVFCTNASKEKQKKLEEMGMEVICYEGETEVPIEKMLEECAKRKIDSILVEGGGKIHGSFLKAKKADKVYAYIAPKIAGKSEFTPINGFGIEKMADAISLKNMKVQQIGKDVLLTGYPDFESLR